ncbi:kinase-like domain-containing protein [Irpex lacteus]|nr:kinase-like domain-containing protein [Irpex lacteus]
MDYYEGGDLFAAVIDRQSFAGDDARVKSGFVQLLDAVDACHELGPENILCSSDDSHFFLSDFGLATQLEIKCIGIAEQPTPYSTRQSDIWSLGVILVNMLTGRNPWRTASIDDDGYCMYLHSTTHFLHQILPMISTDAVEILARIFDPDPTTRISIPSCGSWFSPRRHFSQR